MFQRAQRKTSFLRLAISGPAGSGKTYTALWMAQLLADGRPVCVIDSEAGSASLYARNEGEPESTPEEIARGEGRFDFAVSSLDRYTIQAYRAEVADARAAEPVLVVDSLSHAWNAALEAVDAGGGWAKAGKNISPLYAGLFDDLLRFPGHVLATVRSKMEHVIDTNDAGRVVGVRKVGMSPVLRTGGEYEFGMWFELDREGRILVDKTRCPLLPLGSLHRRDAVPELVASLQRWLRDGAAAQTDEVEAILRELTLTTTVDQIKALAARVADTSPDVLSREDRERLRPAFNARLKLFRESR